MMKNKKHNHIRSTNYLPAIIGSLGFLAVGLLLVLYIGNQSRQETLAYINEAVQQSQYNVDTHIDAEFQTMYSGVILNEDRAWVAEDASFYRMVDRLLNNNTFVQVGVVNADGDVLWADREGRRGRTHFYDEECIQKALGGEKAVSETRWDEMNGLYVNDYAVPVYNEDGVLRGALFVSDPEDELRAVVDHSLFANEGFAQIIHSNGEYVVQSQNPLRLAGDKDVFDMPAPVDPEVKQQLLDDMSAGRSGHLQQVFDGVNRMAAYAPSKYNDWYIFYSVPEHLVNAGMQNITYGAMSVIGIAGIVFLFFILMIRRSNKNNQRKLEDLAFIDPVTGGSNLQKFRIDAQKLLESTPHEGYAICYADIKGFKYINDIFGRRTGDELLRHLWEALRKDARENETFAHVNADIFVALCCFEDQEMAKRRYGEIAKYFATFPTTAAKHYKVELYGGVYMVDKRDTALTLDDMLDRALEAQEDVKQRGGGSRVEFYSNEMRAQKLWETEVDSKMEQALENNEFKIYLQPKIGIQNGNHIAGMEALVRWEPAGQDQIPPSRFIDLFERNGFITTLDRYMVEKVCQTYKELEMAAADSPPVLSVNISRLSLLQSDVVEVYTDIKNQYDLPDGLIELEFTEGLLFENHERFQTIVEQFRKRGFLCSLDDFGAGYSSLNILKSLRVDVLKLDKLFFDYGGDEERGRELVRMIMSLAKSLHIKTVAEGVEDEEEVRWLRKIGCDAVQGYVFSKPLPTEEFMEFWTRWQDPMNHEEKPRL